MPPPHSQDRGRAEQEGQRHTVPGPNISTRRNLLTGVTRGPAGDLAMAVVSRARARILLDGPSQEDAALCQCWCAIPACTTFVTFKNLPPAAAAEFTIAFSTSGLDRVLGGVVISTYEGSKRKFRYLW